MAKSHASDKRTFAGLSVRGRAANFASMSTITAILEADVDGTLHLPLPAELRHGKVKVTADLEPAEQSRTKARAGLWKEMSGRFWMSADFDEPLDDFREYM